MGITTFSLAISVFLAGAVAADSQEAAAVESLFGAKILKATASVGAKDDHILAAEMLAAAQGAADAPKLAAALCERAWPLTGKDPGRDPAGAETAIEILDTWMQADPTRRGDCLEKMVDLRQQQFIRSRGADRPPIARKFLKAADELAEIHAEAGDWTAAVAIHRRQLPIAQSFGPDEAQRIRARMEIASHRFRIERQIEELRTRLLEDANDTASAEVIVRLQLIELDQPGKAAPYLSRMKAGELKTISSYAARPVDQLSAAEAMPLADWYRAQSGKAQGAAKHRLLSRAKAALDRFLTVHADDDLQRKTAIIARDAVHNDLEKLEAAGAIIGKSEAEAVFLCDLQERDVQTLVNDTWSFGKKGKLSGRWDPDISVDGVKSPNGLGMHPSDNQGSSVTYELDGKYADFRGAVAINDSVKEVRDVSLTFRIVADGREIWRSKPHRQSGKMESFSVSTRGVKKLQLIVDCPGGAFAAHAIWFEPRLIPR